MELLKCLSCWTKKKLGAVDLNDFVSTVSTILRGSLEERLEFCFQLYDGDGDKFISTEEFEYAINVLYCLIQEDQSEKEEPVNTGPKPEDFFEEEALNDVDVSKDEQPKIQTFDRHLLAEVFKKIDTDKDNRISFPDFKEALKDPLISLSFNIDLIAL